MHSQTAHFDLTCTDGAYNKVLKVEVNKWAQNQNIDRLEGQIKHFHVIFLGWGELIRVVSGKIKRGEAELGGWCNSSKVGYYTKYGFPYKQFAQKKKKRKKE